MARVIRVKEVGRGEPQPLSQRDVDALKASALFVAEKAKEQPGLWRVRLKPNMTRVGTVRVEHLHVRIDPKFPIRRVLFLLGYSTTRHAKINWQDDLAGYTDAQSLVPAFAHLLWRRIDAAFAPGLLTGYVPHEMSSTVLRGRVRESSLLNRSRGLGYPLEVQHDELSPDILENQVLKAALARMLTIGDLSDAARRGLLRQLILLRGVSAWPLHQPVPNWRPSRFNGRYAEAYALASLVLSERSAEHGEGTILADGFLVDMKYLFEDFVREAIGRELVTLGGGKYGHPTLYLDQNRTLKMLPDLVWERGNKTAALADAKYMAERQSLSGSREAIFQMVTY
ncbi:McrC family protein [Actinomadura rupiterrae]|uniref:McrC family protein n=1 Tax=Actinomadura rupiterrae TaxID=559627 RepID=UPI0020A5F93A|nr:McrC family protein [Actinomadura rupiterrae]MCP2337361.1 5-methylcytosine-specific restriction enzyme subunit McrC [Actinomadura rupiterrae]